MKKNLLLLLAAAFLAAWPAHAAQISRATMKANITSNFSDNTSGNITPALTRSQYNDMADSGIFFSDLPTAAGLLYQDGAGNISNALIGTGLSFSGGTLTATGGGGGGTGGGGTVNTGTAGQPAFYATTGAAVSGEPNVSDLSNVWTYGINATTNPAFAISAPASSVDYILASGTATGGTLSLKATGPDTAIGVQLCGKNNTTTDCLSVNSSTLTYTYGSSTTFTASSSSLNVGTSSVPRNFIDYGTAAITGLTTATGGLQLPSLTSTLLKTDGSGNVAAAVAGTDYSTATVPTGTGQVLYNNAGALAASSLLAYNTSVSSPVYGLQFAPGASGGSPSITTTGSSGTSGFYIYPYGGGLTYSFGPTHYQLLNSGIPIEDVSGSLWSTTKPGLFSNGNFTLGVAGTSSAALNLADGTSGGGTVTVAPGASTVTYTLKLPAAAPTAVGQVLAATDTAGTLGFGTVTSPVAAGTASTLARYTGANAIGSDVITSDGAGNLGAVGTLTGAGNVSLTTTAGSATLNGTTSACVKRNSSTVTSICVNSSQNVSGQQFVATGFSTSLVTLSGATPAIDASKGLQTITLSANTTPTATNIAAGERVTIEICQPASGGPYTWTWPSTYHGGLTIGTTASTCSVQSFNGFSGTTMLAESGGITGLAP